MNRRAVIASVLLLVGLAVPGAARAAPARAMPETATENITQLDVGGTVACARLANGLARCWGNDTQGSLGNGPPVVTAHPVTVVAPGGVGALTGVAEVATGTDFACARLDTGGVRCWGSNTVGQLGADYDGSSSALPVAVRNPTGTGSLRRATRITAGGAHACAVLGSTEIVCWGQNSSFQLGDGTTTQRNHAAYVLNPAGTAHLTNALDVTAGGLHTCVLMRSSQPFCWGAGGDGQLGDGTTGPAPLPRPVLGIEGEAILTGVSVLSAGGASTCAVTRFPLVLCWGDNAQGQLGQGTEADGDVPGVVQSPEGDADLADATDVDVGFANACARRTTGRVVCWGDGTSGGLGAGSETGATDDSNLPVTVLNLPGTGPLANAVSLAVGNAACTRLVNGQARCWGSGANGLLGNGGTSNRYRPVVVLRR